MTLEVYTRERTVIKETRQEAAGGVVEVMYMGIVLQFYDQLDGVFEGDITDIVQMYAAGGDDNFTVSIYAPGGELISSVVDTMKIVGTIKPENLVMPLHPFIERETLTEIYNEGIVLFPSMIYRKAAGVFTDHSLILAMRLPEDYLQFVSFHAYRNNVETTLQYLGGAVVLPPNVDVVCERLRMVQYNLTRVRTILCGHTYALVRWVGRDGYARQLLWEVEDVQLEQGEQYALYNMNTPFDIHGGAISKMTLKLDNLCAYDYWWYSDIITSSDVRVIVDNEALFDDSARVQVTTKNVTIPNGDNGATLRVNINFRKYDAD